MQLAKFILQLAKNIFQRSILGKCKPQKIFSKPQNFFRKQDNDELIQNNRCKTLKITDSHLECFASAAVGSSYNEWFCTKQTHSYETHLIISIRTRRTSLHQRH